MYATNCYTENCGFGALEPEITGQKTEELCRVLTAQIIEAGGAGLMEVSPCPMIAMGELAPKASDAAETRVWKQLLCGRLGIIGFSREPLEGEL